MRNLVKRYIAHLQRCKQQTEGITEDDVAEIKQDISAFRYELLGILQNAGFDTGHVDLRQERISRSKKRSLMAERRLLSGVTESISIPMPERLLNGTSDDEKAEEPHEVDRKERRGLPVPMPAVKFASKLKKVLPIQRTSDAVIKPRFVRNVPAGWPFISRGLERNLNALIDVNSLPANIKPTKIARSTTNPHIIQKEEEDDEDLELVVESDEDDVANDKEDSISLSSAGSGQINPKRNRLSTKSRHYRTGSICLEMSYLEDSSFTS